MQQIDINLKSFDNYYIKKSLQKIYRINQVLNGKIIYFLGFPTTKKKFTLLRSPHIDKKSREQFELQRKKTCLSISVKNVKTVSLFLFLLKNSELPGVELSISVTYSTFF